MDDFCFITLIFRALFRRHINTIFKMRLVQGPPEEGGTDNGAKYGGGGSGEGDNQG